MAIRLGLIAAAVAAFLLVFYELLSSYDEGGYQRCMAEATANTNVINRDVVGVNADSTRRAIEQEGRLKVLSVDALTGVKNIPQCAASECALDGRFIGKLKELRE